MAVNMASRTPGPPEVQYDNAKDAYTFVKSVHTGSEMEAPHVYDKLQHGEKRFSCHNINRLTLILVFLVVILVTNATIGIAVWYTPRNRGSVASDLCLSKETGNNPVCCADWKLSTKTKYCYQAFTDRMEWFHAKGHCETLGANLASSREPDEQFFLEGLMAIQNGSDIRYWIGGNDIAEKDSWKWADGEPIGSWQPWNPGEPEDYGGGEGCMAVSYTGIREWADYPCSEQFRFICSKPAKIDISR